MKSNSFGMSSKNIKVIKLAFLRHEFHVFYPQVGLDFSRHDGDCHASSDLYTKLLSFNLKEVFEKYPLLTHDLRRHLFQLKELQSIFHSKHSNKNRESN